MSSHGSSLKPGTYSSSVPWYAPSTVANVGLVRSRSILMTALLLACSALGLNGLPVPT